MAGEPILAAEWDRFARHPGQALGLTVRFRPKVYGDFDFDHHTQPLKLGIDVFVRRQAEKTFGKRFNGSGLQVVSAAGTYYLCLALADSS